MRPSDRSYPLTRDVDFRFYVGVHHPRLAWPLTLRGFRVCISANVLPERVCEVPFLGCDEPWLLDSGAFTQVALQGGFSQSPKAYAAMVRRYAATGLIAASTQDYMCEPVALKATGLTVARHQALTLDRFDAIQDAGTGRVHLLAVLQGRTPDDYRRHLEAYGARIGHGAWVGVGSLCKRQGDPAVIPAILDAILQDRPDLRLHGFGCKRTSLRDEAVRRRLATADSMAWSYAARFSPPPRASMDRGIGRRRRPTQKLEAPAGDHVEGGSAPRWSKTGPTRQSPAAPMAFTLGGDRWRGLRKAFAAGIGRVTTQRRLKPSERG